MPFPIRPNSAWKTRPGWSEFGAARPALSGGKHNGFDYYCLEGTPIYSTGPGVVTAHGTGTGPNSFGNYIRITYDDGVHALYAHMREKALVADNKRVDANSHIGNVGHTGSAALVIWDGLRHVHEELSIGGKFINPISYHGAQAAGGGETPVPEKKRKAQKMPWLTRDTSPTYFMGTDQGLYVVPTQALAESIDRVLQYTPTRADLDYFAQLIAGPRYGGPGIWLPPVGQFDISDADIAQLAAEIDKAAGDAENQDPDEIAAAVALKLAPTFDAIPTAEENADAVIKEIAD